MNSQANPPSLILTRRLADGTVEWIPLEIPQRMPAAAEADYALIDRADYEAPQTLVARRQGEDLIVEVQGTEVLVLGGFFATPDVAFHPTTDIAGGAGPFSGTPLTPDSPVQAGSPAGEQVVWSAEPREGEPVVQSGEDGQGGGSSPLLWGGLAAGGLGLALAAGGGGGGGGGNGGGDGDGDGGGDPDDSAPVITSGADAAAIDENSGAGQLVYTAAATDDGTVTWSLADGGDAAAFSIDATTGAVTLADDPDFETQSSYDFTVVATDDAGNSSEQAVSLPINDVDEAGPSIISGATATAIDENSGSSQVVYTAATDGGTVTWSLQGGGDAAAFSIDAGTGVVTLLEDPDHEAQSGYGFTVVATDADGNNSAQAVSLEINDLDEVAPDITSGDTATAIDENSGAGQVIYTVTSTDDGDVSAGTTTYSLAPTDDAASFGIDADTGAVTLSDDPDYETKFSYSFTVVATDAAGNSSEQAVSLAIDDVDDDVDDDAPIITSGPTAGPIDENSGDDQLVYTATATDDGPVTWSLGGDDEAEFDIDEITGAVTLTEDPDFEDQDSYSFTVVATDAEGNSSDLTVSLTINDAPMITSGDTADPIDENSGAGQVVYVATVPDDVSVTWSLGGDDGAAFDIDENTGVVTLTADPDYEEQDSYSFTVVATDADSESSAQAVSLDINDVDEDPPIITSGATADSIDENSGPGQVVYTAVATDDGSVTWSLADLDDPAAFSIDATTGAVTLTDDPDFETTPLYSFTVVATDEAGNSSEQAVLLAINDVDEDDDEGDGEAAVGLSVSMPSDDAADVSVDGDSMRTFSEQPQIDGGNIATSDIERGPSTDSSIVVFDLVQGSSSDHSGRTFESGVSYDIHIRIDSDDHSLSTAGGGPGSFDIWSGSENLGSDDRIVLVGDGDGVQGPSGLLSPANQLSVDATAVRWDTGLGSPAALVQDRTFTRFHAGDTASAALFGTALPADFLAGQGGQTSTLYLANMPAGILTSQGLI